MFNKKGQSTLEYAVLLSLVMVSLLVMMTPLKRHIQGGIQNSADQISQDKYTPSQRGRIANWQYTEDQQMAGQGETTYSESRKSERIFVPNNGQEYYPGKETFPNKQAPVLDMNLPNNNNPAGE
jgi:hypothetical protein